MTTAKTTATILAALLLATAGAGCLGDDGTPDQAPGDSPGEEPAGDDQPPDQDDGASSEEDLDGNASSPDSGSWVLRAVENATLPNNAGAGTCELFSFDAPVGTRTLEVTVEAPAADPEGGSAGSSNLTLVGPNGTRVPMGGPQDAPEGSFQADVQAPEPGLWTIEASPYIVSVMQEWTASVEAAGSGPAPLTGLDLEPGGC